MARSIRPREPSDLAAVKVRCREDLRAPLAALAKASGRSLNEEIVRRLERSLQCDDLLSVVRDQIRAEFEGRLSDGGIAMSLKTAIADVRRDDIARLRTMTTGMAQRAVLAASPTTEKAN